MITQKQKDDWLAALRSGEYKQCTGSLKKDDGYCCLGVLGEVTEGFEFEKTKQKTKAGTRSNYFLTFPESECEIKGSWTGLLNSPLYLGDTNQSYLMGMNDSEDKNFNQIADWVEKNITVD